MIILASNSPRRKELLSMLGYDFRALPADCDERSQLTEPSELVCALSRRKALSVPREQADLVIGSDTVVALNGAILGKPADVRSAGEMLRSLSGKTHTVYTGLCVVYGEQTVCECVSCEVHFKELTEREIDAYLATGEPMDKAGAYGIQGKGAAMIEWIKGDYYAVMGLPCCRLNQILNSFGFFPTNEIGS